MKKLVAIVGFNDYNFIYNQLCELNYSTLHFIICDSFEQLYQQYNNLDIIIASADTKQFSLLENIESVIKHFEQIPIIFISDLIDRTKSINFIEAGAQDFLTKDNYTTEQLGISISFAQSRKKASIRTGNIYEDYKQNFENGPIPMWLIDDTSLHFLEVNNAAIEKYGYPKEEFLTKTLHDICPKEEVLARVDKPKNKTNDYFDDGYWQHKKKNGETFWVHVYSHITRFNDSIARLCFIVDVNEKIETDKKNQELTNQLKEQNDKLDNLLYSINDAIWSRNADTLELIYANNAYFELFGFTSEELKQDNSLFFSNIYSEDREKFMHSMKNAKTTGNATTEYRYCNKSGVIKTLQARVTFKKGINGEADTLNGITVDITKARVMEDKIKESEQNLLSTINNTKDLIWSVNSNLEIIFCNKPYQSFIFELAGIVPKQGDYVLGEWGSKSFIDSRKKDYIRALAGESFSVIVEEEYDGDILYKEFNNNPITDQDGKIIGVNCIARDISEQKKQFVKIQEQNEKLKEIAFIQSHKVRGPVASILGLAELFILDPIDDEHNSEILRYLKIATNNLDDIIREVVGKTKVLKKNKF